MIGVEERPIMFDGKIPKQPRRGRWAWLYVLLMLAVAGIGWLVYQRRVSATAITEPPPISVVSDRPGGGVEQAEATRVLRRHLIGTGVRSECLALRRTAPNQFTAFDTCAKTALGDFEVSGSKVERGRPRPQ